MKLPCVVIEDEPPAMAKLKQYISKVPLLDLVGSFDNPGDAMNFILQNHVEVMFVDIEMDGLSGIEFLRAIPVQPEVILTTAYAEYAIEGFDLKVTDYLLKPYSFERFLQAVSRIKTRVPDNPITNGQIFVKTEYRLERVMFNDIYFIEGLRDYRMFVTEGKKIICPTTFTELEQSLPSSIFARAHKSYIVSIPKIDKIERDRIYIRNHVVPISETYRQSFYNLLNRI